MNKIEKLITVSSLLEDFDAPGIICEMRGNGSGDPFFEEEGDLSDYDKEVILRGIEKEDLENINENFKETLDDLGFDFEDFQLVSEWQYFDRKSEYISDNACMYRFWF